MRRIRADPGTAQSRRFFQQTEISADPLGRSTPRGTIVDFSRAVDRKEYATAASYLQLEPAQINRSAELAATLKSLIDRELQENIGRISDAPEGDVQDGLAQDREQIGPMVIDGKNIYITLVARAGREERPGLADLLRDACAMCRPWPAPPAAPGSSA